MTVRDGTVSLLPCPFCGATDIATDGPSATHFMCNDCGSATYEQDSHEEAIAAWNRRPGDARKDADPSEVFGVALTALPKLAAAAGCYVGITVTEEKSEPQP